MFENSIPARAGIRPMDASPATDKDERVQTTMMGGQTMPETAKGKGDYQINKASDVLNAFFLKTKPTGAVILPRGGYGSWSFAAPMVKDPKGWRPMFDPANPDADFEYVHPVILNGGAAVPDGSTAVVVATVGHGSRQLVGFLGGSGGGGGAPIISDWRSKSPPDYSTFVHDMQGGSLDSLRKAGFHTFTRVQKWMEPCQKYKWSGIFAVALNGTKHVKDKTGLLFTHFKDNEAFLSHEAWGPLRPATSYHEVGFGDVGINSGAIDTAALYTGGNEEYDMPLPFEEEDEKSPRTGRYEYRVFLWRRKKWKRKWLCKERERRWDLHVKIPVTETPPCNPTKTAPPDSDGVPTRSYPVAASVIAPGFFGAQGFNFNPRPGLLYGKFPRAA